MSRPAPIRSRWNWPPRHSGIALAVHRWHQAGYVEVVVADRHERVRAEPFDAIELPVGVLFGDDDD